MKKIKSKIISSNDFEYRDNIRLYKIGGTGNKILKDGLGLDEKTDVMKFTNKDGEMFLECTTPLENDKWKIEIYANS